MSGEHPDEHQQDREGEGQELSEGESPAAPEGDPAVEINPKNMSAPKRLRDTVPVDRAPPPNKQKTIHLLIYSEVCGLRLHDIIFIYFYFHWHRLSVACRGLGEFTALSRIRSALLHWSPRSEPTRDELTLDLPILNIKTRRRASPDLEDKRRQGKAGASISLLISILRASELPVTPVYSRLLLGPSGWY